MRMWELEDKSMVTVAADRLKETAGRLIDVRNLDEFAGERLPEVECVPLDRLLTEANKWDREEQLILMCQAGMRSSQAVEQLRNVGFSNVSMVDGGLDACRKAGLEVIVERKRIPIFRQVMIWAGLLLLLGLGLSLVNPWFLAITWFVAGGLVFAGVTGICPMAKMLERMPWNKVSACGGQTSCRK